MNRRNKLIEENEVGNGADKLRKQQATTKIARARATDGRRHSKNKKTTR
jgi:hypothetical protein